MSDDIYRIEKKGSNYLIHREEGEKPIKIPQPALPSHWTRISHLQSEYNSFRG